MKFIARLKDCLRTRWTPPPPPGPSADTFLLEDARARRQDTLFRAPEVHRLTAKLEREAEINHFGEAISVAIQKRHA